MHLVETCLLLSLSLVWAVSETDQRLCCIQREDVKVHRIGAGNWPVITIDNFFCNDVLEQLETQATQFVNHVKATYNSSSQTCQRMDSNSSADACKSFSRAFPGILAEDVEVDQFFGGQGVFSKLARGDHLLCIADFLSSLATAGHIDRDAADLLSIPQVQGFIHDAERPISMSRLVALTAKPPMRTIHVDSRQTVMNFHLSRGYDDTGTSFWRTIEDFDGKIEHCAPRYHPDIYHGAAWTWECKFIFESADAVLDEIRQATGEGINYTHLEDTLSTFEQYARIDYRYNRAAIYDGALPHTAFIPPAARDRMLQGEVERTLVQSFVPDLRFQRK